VRRFKRGQRARALGVQAFAQVRELFGAHT